jgi:hypothetical protein
MPGGMISVIIGGASLFRKTQFGLALEKAAEKSKVPDPLAYFY